MAMLRMPYNNAMRLGQGVNSFTQQLCMIDAVTKKTKAQKLSEAARDSGDNQDDDPNGPGPPVGISQIVSYSSRLVDKVSDVTTGTVSGHASGKYIDTDKFKESDLNFLIQVKVTNQEHMDTDYTEFHHMKTVERTRFTEVYGDTFISGWEEGGEFNALVSVKLHDKSNATHISGEIEASIGKGLVEGKGNGALDKTFSEHKAETTITVNWSGGGQIKPVDALWTIEAMTQTAANFPDLVAMTPQRKYAILTKYTMLPSYLIASTEFSPLDYENAGIYSSYLLEAYTDYKALWKSLQVLSEEYQAGFRNAELHETSLPTTVTDYLRKFEEEAKKAAEADAAQNELDIRDQIQAALIEREKKRRHQPGNSSTEHTGGGNGTTNVEPQADVDDAEDLVALANRVLGRNKFKRYKPNLPKYATFPATILGIQEAQRSCRLEMVKIVNEVDMVTKDPSIALDADRKTTFISAAIFKQLVPFKEIIVFYDGNAALLPQTARDSLQYFSDRISICRISAPWTQFGETTSVPDAKLFFNDLDMLVEDDRAFATRVATKDGIVTGITTFYTSGRASHRGIQYEYGNFYEFDWNSRGKNLSSVIRSILVEGHRQVATGRSVVDKLVAETSDGKTQVIEATGRSTERVRNTFMHPPSSSWDFRGWWGYTSDLSGFTHLGAIWDLVRPIAAPIAPPMYEAGALDSMPAALKKYIQDAESEGVGMGRYYRISKCVGVTDHVTSNATPFASYFGGSCWKNRGAAATSYIFYYKDKAMCGIYAQCPIGHNNEFPNGILTLGGTNNRTFDISKNLPQITQVKFQTKKNDKQQAILVRVWLSDGTAQLNDLADADSTATGLETVVTISRPASEPHRDWLLGGFYGLIGTSIENIGVVWVAKQAFSNI